MKKKSVTRKMTAFLLAAAMCVSLCAEFTANAQEVSEGTQQQAEEKEHAGQTGQSKEAEQTGSSMPKGEENKETNVQKASGADNDKEGTADAAKDTIADTTTDTTGKNEAGVSETSEEQQSRKKEDEENKENTEAIEAQEVSEQADETAAVQEMALLSASGLNNPRIEKDSSMTAEQKVTWDCVWFGSYPQAEVVPSANDYTAVDKSMRKSGDIIEDSGLYNKLKSASGWNTNNDITLDGNQYRRMKKSDATYAPSGSSGYYNWSDSDTYLYFKYEPIKWRVLKVNGNQAFLLSDIALDDQRYHTVSESITWETSTIRSWLNGYGASSNKQGKDYSSKNFIGSAFSGNEKSAIVNTSVVNDNNINYGTEGGNNTTDKIFLLSESEVYGDNAVTHGFVSSYNTYDEARRCKSSIYAKAMGTYSSTSNAYKGNCWWWLRSPGNHASIAADVNYYGYVYDFGNNVYGNLDGVRAALNLNLSSNLYTYAGTVSSDGTMDEKNKPDSSTTVVIPGKVTHYGAPQTEKSEAEFVQEAAKEFTKAADEYIGAMNSAVRAGVNSSNEIEAIRAKDQSGRQPILSLIVTDQTVSEEVTNAGYACLTEFFRQYREEDPSIGDIDISASMISIEAKIIKAIKTSIRSVNVQAKYGKYTAKISGGIFLNGAFGGCKIQIRGNGHTYTGTVNSTLDDSKKVMAAYIKALGEAEEEVIRQGLKSYLRDYARYTCISDFTSETINSALADVADYLQAKNWGKKVLEYGVKLYDGYDFVKSIVKATNDRGLSDSLSDAQNIYNKVKSMSYTDSSVKDKAIKTTTKNIEAARKKLEDALWTYIYHTKSENGTLTFWDKVQGTFKKITGHCPVDFIIFDKNGNVLGSAEDGYCEYTDDIYIEVSDDVKIIYVPNNMQIRVCMTGTDIGKMSYVVEQYQENVPVGRKNYYDVPLTNGNIYNQVIPAGNISADLSDNILTADDGSDVKADEYLSASDKATVNLSCKATGKGNVFGTGTYVKGDAAELVAYPDEGYYFDGWYDGDDLVGIEAVYRLPALGDKEIKAVFSKKNKSKQTITGKDFYTVSLGDKIFHLNASSNGSQLYYISRDKNIADVDKDGNVKIAGTGIVQIIVISPENEEYSEAIKEISINVLSQKESDSENPDNKENPDVTDSKGTPDKTGSPNSGNSTSTKTGNKKKINVSKIRLSGISKKIAAGKKIKLTASIKPSNAVNKKLIWKSSNKKVATVNSKGVVTIKKKTGGKKVTITATATDGSKVKETYKITSMKGVVKKVAISGKKTVKAGKTLKLKAKVTATKKANKTLKWTSSNKKYATVSSSGKVKALKAGKGKKVKITAMATDGSGKKKSLTIKIK